jgi:DHA3 family macrolide efflux protein-like MFS transporter
MDSSRWKLQFLAIWTGQAVSLIGSELVGFALIWWLTLQTGSGLTLAMATVVTYLPIIVLGPLAGTLVDRWNRRLIMIAADGAIALFTVFLAYLYWRGAAQVWHIYAILFLRSLGTCFHLPAMQASTPLIVPEAYLVRVAGMNEALSGVVYIVASPLAAWLLSVLSIQGILAIDVVTALVAIATLFFAHIPQPERATGKRAQFVGDLGEGARYLSSQRGLFLMFAIDALRRFVTLPPFMMLPLLVTRHFAGGAPELGWLQSAYGLGYVLGGLILGAWGGFRRRIVTASLGLFGYGLSMLAMGAAPANGYWLAFGGYLGIGGMLVIYNGSIAALLQSCVPPDMQGRVFSLKRSVEKVIIPVGLLASGPLADAIDVRLLFIAGGIVCFLCGIAWVSTPIIMRLECDSVLG